MRSRLVVPRVFVPLIVALALASLGAVSTAAEAAEHGIFVVGASFQEDDTEVYAYGELSVLPTLSVGLEYLDKNLALSAWHGERRGVYGEVGWKTDDSDAPKTWEVGVWAGTQLTETIDVYGWLGFRGQWDGGSDTWVAVGAEAYIPVHDPFFVNIGLRSWLSDDSITRGVVGVGVRF